MEINWRAPPVHTRYIVIVVRITTFTIAIIDITIISGIFDFIISAIITTVRAKKRRKLI